MASSTLAEQRSVGHLAGRRTAVIRARRQRVLLRDRQRQRRRSGLNANGFPANANYNEALVKVVADPTTSPRIRTPNGWGLKVADYFIPYNVAALDRADSDFGSGAPIILPDSAGIPGHPHLMIAGGKEGKIYFVDRDNMGKFDPNNDHVLNAVPDGSGHNYAAERRRRIAQHARLFQRQDLCASAATADMP